MRRPLLLTLIALGSLVCLIGSTGLFAALTDTARTGTNQVDSGQLAGSADIQLATATTEGSAVQCGTFSDDLATALVTASDVQVNWSPIATFLCIQNIGSQPVTLSVMVDELVDTDTACTGDEAVYDTTTCGGNQLGELSTVLGVQYDRIDCSTSAVISTAALTLKANATEADAAGTLASGATGCLQIIMSYPSWHTPAEIQMAQSDRATWRFQFIADAAAP